MTFLFCLLFSSHEYRELIAPYNFLHSIIHCSRQNRFLTISNSKNESTWGFAPYPNEPKNYICKLLFFQIQFSQNQFKCYYYHFKNIQQKAPPTRCELVRGKCCPYGLITPFCLGIVYHMLSVLSSIPCFYFFILTYQITLRQYTFFIFIKNYQNTTFYNQKKSYNIVVASPIQAKKGGVTYGYNYIIYYLCYGKYSSLLCLQMVGWR